jgi:hypothetical protein
MLGCSASVHAWSAIHVIGTICTRWCTYMSYVYGRLFNCEELVNCWSLGSLVFCGYVSAECNTCTNARNLFICTRVFRLCSRERLTILHVFDSRCDNVKRTSHDAIRNGAYVATRRESSAITLIDNLVEQSLATSERR